MVKKYHLTDNFLDDKNLEYGIVPPRFIKDDLFNTYLQFGKLEQIKYLFSIDQSLNNEKNKNTFAFKNYLRLLKIYINYWIVLFL